MSINVPAKPIRKFLPQNFSITEWDKLSPYFEGLLDRDINSKDELELWLTHKSELEAVLEEDMAWRYIKMNIDTTNEELSKSFNHFVSTIQPNIAPFSNKFNKKLVESKYVSELDDETYFIMLRSIKKQIEIFREENIPLETELQTESQKFGAISAKMMVEINGEKMTMQKASTILKSTDRTKREKAYSTIVKRRLEDKNELDELFNKLIKLRHNVGKNADFDNFRDYKFASMGRFDYTKEDCFKFHEAIQQNIVPITKQFLAERSKKLNISPLRPWDTEVDADGNVPLKPFNGSMELINKTVKALSRIHPYFGECIQIMDKMGHLDLESKEGKAPGGFNYPLYEIGVPFIYMNAVGSFRDVITMIHESGHAVHSFLSRDLSLCDFKSLPSEVAELASMSMELLTMDAWDEFFSDKDELKRAKKEHLEKILDILPWITMIDKFQHWIYENPQHTSEEREHQWNEISKEFSTGLVDHSGFEEAKATSWQRQLHLYEVPFYYIEYGMAQLGAIAVWRNYKQNGEKAIQQYMDALKLGYTKSIGEIYQTAGIQFDFSSAYVNELADFVKEELTKIK